MTAAPLIHCDADTNRSIQKWCLCIIFWQVIGKIPPQYLFMKCTTLKWFSWVWKPKLLLHLWLLMLTLSYFLWHTAVWQLESILWVQILCFVEVKVKALEHWKKVACGQHVLIKWLTVNKAQLALWCLAVFMTRVCMEFCYVVPQHYSKKKSFGYLIILQKCTHQCIFVLWVIPFFCQLVGYAL